MTSPRIEVDLDMIRLNARHLVQRLGQRGIGVTAVTKAVCGHPEIAGAFLEGGVTGLADARVENVERMRRAGIAAPISLIRSPSPGQANRVVQACSTSYNTEFDTIDALARAARRMHKVHDVILMVEMGDRREGLMPGDLVTAARAVLEMPGVALKGIAANFACLGGIAPDASKMAELAALARRVETACSQKLDVISGGNSANLPWALASDNLDRINELRLGEALLLGVDPLTGVQIEGLATDAFTLIAEVIESKIKPRDLAGASKPVRMQPAWQSIVALGYQDTDLAGLRLPAGLASLGGTSDHFVVDTGGLDLPIGAEIAFRPNYNALMRAMNAPGVAQVMRNRRPQSRLESAARHGLDLATA